MNADRQPRRIAVIVRLRATEALRMAVGLTVLNDEVSVYIAEPLGALDDMAAQYIEALSMMDVSVRSMQDDARFARISAARFAEELLESDSVVAY